MAKNNFYSLEKILKENADYNVIFGERSNGKSFSVHEYGIKKYWETGEQMALVRRWTEDFIGKRGQTMFDGVVNENVISKITGGVWTGVYYWSSRWYLCRYENNERITDETPFCLGFSLNAQEHDKSTSYPKITTVLFDEFLSRSIYLPDEFVIFMNVLSTIIRQRNNVKIFMLGNTINKYCPYFTEMGLKHAKTMKPGSIDVYKYGNTKLRVAVEYTLPNVKGKPSDFYFAFDNPKLAMITGGDWEIDIYPHCPCKYKPKEIVFTYFILFDSELLQCDIVRHSVPGERNFYFTFIHRKTTPIKNLDRDIVFSPSYSPRVNNFRKITKPRTVLEKKIAEFYLKDKVFYQDNEVGEIVRNYLLWCGKEI